MYPLNSTISIPNFCYEYSGNLVSSGVSGGIFFPLYRYHIFLPCLQFVLRGQATSHFHEQVFDI